MRGSDDGAMKPRLCATCAGRTAAPLLAAAALAVAVGWPSAEAVSAQAAAAPAFEYREASGCGGLTLYSWNEARTEVLVVRVNQERIALANGETDLTVDPANPDVTVRVEMTGVPRDDFPYCSGSAASGPPPAVWTAAAGRVKVTVNRRPKAAISPVSVQVDRLVLTGPDGTEARQRRAVRFAAAIADPIK